MSSPRHSIGSCPICGDGLCGIRILSGTDGQTYPLVICDECEATWTEPDLSRKPHFPDPENALSPVDGQALWGSHSHWADLAECVACGWLDRIDPALTSHGPEPSDDDPLSTPPATRTDPA